MEASHNKEDVHVDKLDASDQHTISRMAGSAEHLVIKPAPGPSEEFPLVKGPVDNVVDEMIGVGKLFFCQCGKSFSSLFWYLRHLKRCLPEF